MTPSLFRAEHIVYSVGRKILMNLVALVAMIPLATAQSTSYPERPIRIVVPFTAGSATDTIARMIGQQLGEATGQTMLIDNKPGAGANIGAEIVARAPADGYTLLLATNTTHAANVHLFKTLPYDPEKDFAPVVALAKGPLIFAVHPSIPVNSVQEFTALAKKQPGKLSFGSGSSSSRSSVELYQQMAGIQLLHVPYKSNPPAVADLVSGQVDMMIADPTTLMPQIKAGKLRGLATSGVQRAVFAPDWPTISESGVSGYEMVIWFAVYAPAKTPEAIIKKLNELITKAVHSPMGMEFWKAQGYDPFPGSPSDLARWARAETAKWGKIIRSAGIEPE